MALCSAGLLPRVPLRCLIRAFHFMQSFQRAAFYLADLQASHCVCALQPGGLSLLSSHAGSM